MNERKRLKLLCLGIGWPALMFCIDNPGFASEPEATDTNSAYMSFIPFIKERPCSDRRYRQLAVSLPLQGLSDGDEGHPWRAMYGFCVAQRGRLSLHQDWVVSYLDVRPFGIAPGGDGIAVGTDFSIQWRHGRRASFTPYYELGAGIQYAAITPLPAHGSRWNFTINAGVGVLISVTPTLQLNTALRYLHFSNANLIPRNAGYDAYHFVVGMRWIS